MNLDLHAFDEARSALQAGDRARARSILIGLLKDNPRNEQAWFLLSKTLSKTEDVLYCLERVLQIDPHHEDARQAISSLSAVRPTSLPIQPPVATSDQPADELSQTQPRRIKKSPSSKAPLIPVPPLILGDTTPVRIKSGGVKLKESARPAARVIANALDEQEISQAPRSGANWSLAIGLAIVLILALLAVLGPSLAPRDPLEEHTIIQINGKWYLPPFAIFTAGFPLGSDSFGRDLYSRLLWAIRPTLIMVTIVAIVRLLIGVLIGLFSGWSAGQLGRWLDSLIAAALSVPVLLVALGAIAVVGVELGIWAFIFGLSLTGWVETAQQVREQTRIVKNQIYIEAAHALGASNHEILLGHVLKQIMPMTVMLFAFEVSNTLMTTAGLGFLGYYIGGDVWVDVSDFVARRISGMPELGQMLATSWTTLTQPWAMVVTGSTIFIAILGFNLMGVGLRQNLNLNVVRRRGVVARAGEKARFWLDQNVAYPVSLFLRKKTVQIALAGMLVIPLMSVGGIRIYRWLLAGPVGDLRNLTAASVTSTPDLSALSPLPSETAAPAPITYSPKIDWQFDTPKGFKGGAVLSPTGDVFYVAADALYALRLDGQLAWKLALPATAIGGPVVAQDNAIYVSLADGELWSVNPQGSPRWKFQSEAGDRSTTGPVLAPDGIIYYVVTFGSVGTLQAVMSNGSADWATQADTPSFYDTPVVSPDGHYVFLKDDAFDAHTGALLKFTTDVKVLSYFPGEDGLPYLLSGNTIIQWAVKDNSLVIVNAIKPGEQVDQIIVPAEAGVSRAGVAWKLYTTPGGESSVEWQRTDGTSIGKVTYNISNSQVIAVLPDLTIYVCGNPPFDDQNAECVALSPQAQKPLWYLRISGTGNVSGGFWKDGALYLATTGGKVYALAENKSSPLTAGATPAEIPSSATQGVVWSYQMTGTVNVGPLIGPDGTVYLIDLDDQMSILDADGSLLRTIKLPAGVYVQRSGSGSRSQGPMWPVILPDGTLVVISENNTVYALDRLGNKLWEVPLETNPKNYPVITENGDYYLLDDSAGIYAFNSDGLRWHFVSNAADYTANGLAIDPNGVVYYVVTNRGRGFLQAVSPQGQGLWATDVKTDNFYDDLVLSPDGKLLFLSDDVYETSNGELLSLDVPVPVDQYIAGMDGNLYLRSSYTVIEWRLGGNGFEIVNTAEWGAKTRGSMLPSMTFVDENSVIWMWFRDQIVWLSTDGTVLGTQAIQGNSGQYFNFDFHDTRLTQCRYYPQDQVEDCGIFAPGSDQALTHATLSGVNNIDRVDIQGNIAYILVKTHTIYKLALGTP